MEGIGLTGIGLGLLFWLSLAADYWIEPGRNVRMIVLGLLVTAVLLLLVRFLFWRLFARLSEESLALLIERRFPDLSDRLITSIELARQSHPFSSGMVLRTREEAGRLLAKVRVGEVLSRRPVFDRWLLVAALAATVGGFVWHRPLLAQYWFQRVVLLEPLRYPRQTHMTVLGFDGVVQKIARGRDYELLVDADPKWVVPEKVSVRYRMLDTGARGRSYLTKVGDHRFRYMFKNVLEPIELQVRGGDDRSEFLLLQPVEPPQLREAVLVARFPEYTGLKKNTAQVAGVPIALPVGTQITLTLAANKPLQWLRCLVEDEELPIERIGKEAFSLQLRLNQKMPIQIHFRDHDGIEPVDPFPVDLVAVEDHPPRIEVFLDGVGQAITRNARVPVRCRIEDDYGITKLEFEHAGRTSEPERLPIFSENIGRDEFEEVLVFEVAPLQLELGPEWKLSVVATDGDDLNGPHEGRSRVFRFEIVSPVELLARIATRELNLRQRFEQITREVRSARESLADLRDQLADHSPEVVSLRRLHSERAVQSVRKNANETAGVAAAFADLLAELQNNRVGTTPLFERLEQGIILPLEHLVSTDMPEAILRLEQLRDTLEADVLEERLGESEFSLDLVLERCERILESMRKLESFNEAVALLRTLRDDQKKLLERTKEERKKKILDLLK